MELVHTLNGVVIDEPIGFDNMKTTFKRGDYHGMSVEVSVGELEFYGNALQIIDNAYQTDLDTMLEYKVQADGEELYVGALDLSTYNERIAEYRSISCKVGEIGEKTSFNNRVDVAIDLNADNTIDGEDIANKPAWKKIDIPWRTIVYTNEQKQESKAVYTEEQETGNKLQLPDEFGEAWLNIGLDTTSKHEFGEVKPLFHIAEINTKDKTVAGYADPFCRVTTEGAIDNESNIQVDVDLDCSINIPAAPNDANKPFTNIVGSGEIEVCAEIRFNGYSVKAKSDTQVITNDNYATPKSMRLTWSGVIKKKYLSSVYVGLYFVNKNVKNENTKTPNYYNNPSPLRLEINSGSYIRATLYSQAKKNVSADMIKIFDALDLVVKSASNNRYSLKSDLYDELGDGALKAITNGYKIRGLYTSKDKERNMPVSFKDMIESLNSIDCLGWGIIGNNVRVENWDWFYQDEKLIEVTSPKEITRRLDENAVITELSIGYKKYATSEDIASIDSIHGERVFTTTTSALTRQVTSLCEFIADNYAIEQTRREAILNDTENEFKYDENIFIFSLCYDGGKYTIPNDIAEDNSGTIKYPEEVYNAIISPARNAYRWIPRLFCVNGIKPFKMTKGTINYLAKFSTKQSQDGLILNNDSANNIPLLAVQTEDDQYQEYQAGENMQLQDRYYSRMVVDVDGNVRYIPTADDLVIQRVMRAEEISLTYPISIEEYKIIKSNPYGLVVVDGEECWIKEMTYDFNTSEADFKLIPKAK